MKVNRYKSLVFITVISLNFYLSVKNAHAVDETNECGDILLDVPSVLKPVGLSNDTEIIETSTIDTPGVIKGIFSFPISAERKKQIEIEYKVGDIDNMYFLSRVNPKSLKNVFDAMPAVLMEKVDKITILFREVILQPGRMLIGVSKEEESQLEEAQHRPLTNEMTLVIPYFPQGDYDKSVNVTAFYSGILIPKMRHQLGHFMTYHRYENVIPGQEWRDAILRDDKNLSSDVDVVEAEDNEHALSDVDIAEDFANMMEIYLSTHGGLGHPNMTKGYASRFAILDEIVGLDIDQRAKIIERNIFIEGQFYEIDDLLKQLGILNNEGVVYEGINEDTPKEIRDFLLGNPNSLRMMRRLADKALTLQNNGQLNFTSVEASSVRENLIRRLVWPGLFFIPISQSDEANTPQFITDTVDLLDTLSTSEIAHRLYIFNEAIKFIFIEQQVNNRSLLNQESYIIFDRAIKEVQNRAE